MRTATVWLPDSEARCLAKSCYYLSRCARALAPIPAHGATVEDFSVTSLAWSGCGQWLSAAHAVKPAEKAPERPVFPPIRGLG